MRILEGGVGRHCAALSAALCLLVLAAFSGVVNASSAPAPSTATTIASAATAAPSHGSEAAAQPRGHSRTAALLFWLFAAGTLGGAVFVVTRRNMITAVMGMIGTFFALAGLYLMLYASFLAVIQVLVYAGAIMVLFVFVIMVINREEQEPWAVEGLLGKGLAGLGLVYFAFRVAKILWAAKDGKPMLLAPAVSSRGYDFGSVKGVGETLFTDYVFAFEAVSIVLLVAVVGAIAIARPADKTLSPVDTTEVG